MARKTASPPPPPAGTGTESTTPPHEGEFTGVVASLGSSTAGLLKAGIKVISEVRDDVANRRSRVFQAMLGLDSQSAPPAESTEAARQHFDGVFDQRVAQALDRLGYPTAEALQSVLQRLGVVVAYLEQSMAQSTATPPPSATPPVPDTPRPARKRAVRSEAKTHGRGGTQDA